MGERQASRLNVAGMPVLRSQGSLPARAPLDLEARGSKDYAQLSPFRTPNNGLKTMQPVPQEATVDELHN